MDNRPTLHYRGDVRATAGQVVGPNLLGELYVVDEVEWDGERSTVRFRNATQPDVDALWETDPGRALTLLGMRS